MFEWIDGKHIASLLREKIKEEAQMFQVRYQRNPKLAVLLVGDDPASALYVKNKKKAGEEVGISTEIYAFSESTQEDVLLKTIEELNRDEAVDGILCQLPLPKHISMDKVLSSVLPSKDVDGFHPYNRGLLSSGIETKECLLPCTPQGVMHLLEVYARGKGEEISSFLRGKIACVVGRSNIVGRPLAQMLEQKDATVFLCHSKTQNLATLTSQADIVVSAVGKAQFLKKEHFKKGAIVIDVGIQRLENKKICGDVDAEEAMQQVQALTPVPGGVGPMTIAYLLFNTLKAAKQKEERKEEMFAIFEK